MIGSDELLAQLYRQTINLSDDGMIERQPIFRAIAVLGDVVKDDLLQNFKEQPTRAVMLLLKRIGVNV